MKIFFPFIAGALMATSGLASACGTHLPAMQSKINAEESAQLRKLASTTANEAEEIFIGTVTNLERPMFGTTDLGSVSFAVEETLKGKSPTVRTVQWQDGGVVSCQQSAMFLSVGFRSNGKYIVYVRGGQVLRSAAADHLRSGLLTLAEERAIAVAANGT